MNIQKQIEGLNKDISKCQGDLEGVYPKERIAPCKKKENREYGNGVIGKAKPCPVFIPSGHPRSYHSNCIPREMRKRGGQGSPKGKHRKEQFYTDKAIVEVEIKSSKSSERKKQVEPTKKSSWSNILKEQCKSSEKESNSDMIYVPKSCSTLSRPPFSAPPYASRQSYVIDKSIQCENFSPQPLVSSHSLFSNYNPMRTLQFLMTEFHSKVKRMDKDELNTIVHDMDVALQRVLKENCGSLTPQSSSEKSRFSHQFITPPTAPSKEMSDGFFLQKKLEESCLKLEETCKQMEMTCSRLRDEKDQLSREMSEKDLKLDIALERENDLRAKLVESSKQITALTLKSESYARSIIDLKQTVGQLQEENKGMVSLKGTQNKMSSKLNQVLEENTKLNTEKQLLLMEKEKHLLLIGLKEQELAKLKTDLQNIGSLVNQELLNEKLSNTTGSSTLLSSTLGTSMKEEDALICSSPNSSGVTSSPLPYTSWQRVSSIKTDSKDDKKTGGVAVGGGESLVKPLQSIRDMKAELGQLFVQMGREVGRGEPEESLPVSVWSDLPQSELSANAAPFVSTSLTDTDFS